LLGYRQSGSTNDPSNFRPIVLTSVVGKLLHKILSYCLKRYLRVNNYLDTSIQKGFVSGLPGVFEHIYSLSAILEDATIYKKPLMMTFWTLRMLSDHRLIFDMLQAVKVPQAILRYVQSFYSTLSVIISANTWETQPIPFRKGVFQGDTLSPVIFLLVFNPLLKLAEDLNSAHSYRIQLPIKGIDDLPPVDSFVYVKWTDPNGEPPGWYKAQYYPEGTCKIICIYDDNDEDVVYEMIDLREVDWKPCSRRAKKFMSLQNNPSVSKTTWKHVKFANSAGHSLKGYANDVTLISDDVVVHTSVLQTIDNKAADLDLFFIKLAKCVSYLFDGSKIIPQGVFLSNGITRSIVEGGIKFLGKIIDVSLSATKRAASKRMVTRLTSLLSATDSLCVRGEYKLWIYRNYIVSLLHFHLGVDAVSNRTVSQLESTATRYLKKWLNLPRSATRAILYYPGVGCPSITHISREAKLSLLSCVSSSSDLRLQELGLQFKLGKAPLQTSGADYSLLKICP